MKVSLITPKLVTSMQSFKASNFVPLVRGSTRPSFLSSSPGGAAPWTAAPHCGVPLKISSVATPARKIIKYGISQMRFSNIRKVSPEQCSSLFHQGQSFALCYRFLFSAYVSFINILYQLQLWLDKSTLANVK